MLSVADRDSRLVRLTILIAETRGRVALADLEGSGGSVGTGGVDLETESWLWFAET